MFFERIRGDHVGAHLYSPTHEIFFTDKDDTKFGPIWILLYSQYDHYIGHLKLWILGPFEERRTRKYLDLHILLFEETIKQLFHIFGRHGSFTNLEENKHNKAHFSSLVILMLVMSRERVYRESYLLLFKLPLNSQKPINAAALPSKPLQNYTFHLLLNMDCQLRNFLWKKFEFYPYTSLANKQC